MKKFLYVLFFMLFIIFNKPTFAADFNIGREGEIIRPLEATKVKLLKEEIIVRVEHKKSNFTCKTIVENTGPGVEMFVGYPAEEVNATEKSTQTFRDFITYIDGRNMPVMETNSEQEEALPDNPKYNRWFLWPLILESGQTKEITNVFWTENTYDTVGNAFTGFILKPAKYWHGLPGEIKVKYLFEAYEPYTVNSAFPANYSFEGDYVVFKYAYKLPETNIKLSFNPNIEFQLLNLNSEQIDSFWEAKNNKNYDQGLSAIEKHLANKQLSADAKSALKVQKAILLLEKGNKAPAKKIFEEALQRKVNLSAIYYHLSEIYLQDKEINNLQQLYNLAIKRRANPIVLRKIEASLPDGKSVQMPEFKQINFSDITRFTAEIEDENADIESITLQVSSKEYGQTKILFNKELDLQGQAYRYYINENIDLPMYVNNLYCKLEVLDGSGEKIEKTLPLTNRKSRILNKDETTDGIPLAAVLALIFVLLLALRKFFKK